MNFFRVDVYPLKPQTYKNDYIPEFSVFTECQ